MVDFAEACLTPGFEAKLNKAAEAAAKRAIAIERDIAAEEARIENGQADWSEGRHR
jgi:hypothetical protein